MERHSLKDRQFQQGAEYYGVWTESPERTGLSLIFTCESAKALTLGPEGHKAAKQVKEMGIQGSKNGNGTYKDLRVAECLVCSETPKHLEHRM